jgi:hypothetical protein
MCPYYPAYGRSNSMGYQCGICGRFARAQQRVPQCGVCLIPICNSCNHSGFCTAHFSVLSPEDQLQARYISEKIKRSQQIMIAGVLIGLAVFMLAIPLSITSSFHSSYIFTGFFVAMFFFMGLVIGGAIYFQTTQKRGWDKLQEIGLKYRTGGEISPNGTTYPAVRPPGSYFPTQPTFPSQVTFAPPPTQPVAEKSAMPAEPPASSPATRFCPFCGCNLAPDAKFCSNCGSALK